MPLRLREGSGARRLYRRRYAKLCYRGFDPLDAVVDGDRDALVAVHHEVRPADLVQTYGRQFLVPTKGPIYPLPSRLHARLRRQEGPIEVRTPADAPRYSLRRDHPPPKA